MARKISFILSPSNRISATIDNQSYVVAPDHPKYASIVTALREDDADQFKKLVDETAALVDFTLGNVTVKAGRVYYKDREILNSLTRRLIQLMTLAFPFEPLIRFLDNLMLNPSRRAVQELDNWMVHNDIPVTDDGCWLGYKRLIQLDEKAWVTPDLQKEITYGSGEGVDVYIVEGTPTEEAERQLATLGYVQVDVFVDCHTKMIRQWVGKTVEVERNTVDDNFGVACSEGLHVGNMEYVRHFCSENALTTVKVLPQDTVSVPSSENKCRVCRYTIIDIHKKAFTAPVVGPAGEDVDTTRKQVKITLGDNLDNLGTLKDKLNDMCEFVDGVVEEDGGVPNSLMIFKDLSATEANRFASAVEALNDSEITDVQISDYEDDEQDKDEWSDDDQDEDEDEEDDDRHVLVVTFEAHPTTDQRNKFDDAVYEVNQNIDSPDEDDTGNLVLTFKHDDEDELQSILRDVIDFRFVKSAVLNPPKPQKSKAGEFTTNSERYPITFDVVDEDNSLLASPSCKDVAHESLVFAQLTTSYPGCRKVNRRIGGVPA